MGDSTMPVITIGSDNNDAANTIVTVTWSTGECIRYTIVDNETSAHVWQTGYGCPEDDVDFFTWECGDFGTDIVGEFENVAEAIEFCSDSNC